MVDRSHSCQKLTSDTAVNVFMTMLVDQLSIGRPAVLRVLDRLLLRDTSLVLRRVVDVRVRVCERFVVARDCPRAPVRVPEISPTVGTVAVIDHDVRDRLHPIPKQARQH